MNKQKAVFIVAIVLLAGYLAAWWRGPEDGREVDLAAIRVKVETSPGSVLRLLPSAGDGSQFSLPVRRSAAGITGGIEVMEVSVPSPSVPSPPVPLPVPGPYLRYTATLPRIETLLEALRQQAAPESPTAPARRTDTGKTVKGEGRRRPPRESPRRRAGPGKRVKDGASP